MRRIRRSVPIVLAFSVLLGAGPAESPVADAAKKGDGEAVRALLRAGADVNAAQGDGMSALHWAAERGDRALIDVLVYAGADLRATTRIGAYTPLHIASRSGHVDAVAGLLVREADVHATTEPGGSTPLHLGALSGNAAVVRALIESGADPNAKESEWEQTPLIFAASLNRVDAIVALIEGGADPNIAARPIDLIANGRVDAEANRRRTEVLNAFTNDNAWPASPAQIQAAVQAGRQAYTAAPAEEGRASRSGRSSRFQRPVRIRSKGGLTPLLHAARQGHLDAMRALVDHGADVNQIGGGDNTSPLLIATINGQFDAAMLLLERGADPNVASSVNGATPLFATVNAEWQPRTRYPQPQEREQQESSYLDVIGALLAAGADPDTRLTLHPWYMEYTDCGNSNCGLIDTNGSTPFLRAAYATDVEAMRLLKRWGADPTVATKAPARRERRNPDESQREQALEQLADADSFAIMTDSTKASLVVSVWEELPDSVKADYTEERINAAPGDLREEILSHGQRQDSVSALQPDPSGLPLVEEGDPAVHAVHAASGVGYGEGYAGNAHRHVEEGWLPAIRFLIEEVGMDVNLRDHNGYNAIHHAAARGDNELILYLVEHGGDVTAISRRGQTTADMANGPVSRVSPIPETVALLESLGSANSHNCLTCQQQ
ncbi:MAG: ankyrin repeat domain-containing protein [Gemmatimonadetes bacterium]|nr:ankyrin repeat domain-containing protein [Gemmatimonadota bacterium]